jgi:hypothetical protein
MCFSTSITALFRKQAHTSTDEQLARLWLALKIAEQAKFSGLLGFGLCPSSVVLKNTTFRKLDLFPYSGEVVRDIYSVGSVEVSSF